jgi:hypothetical protein
MKLFAAMFLACVVLSCERPLKVTLDGGNPPTFRFDSSGEIIQVGIYEVLPNGKIPPEGSQFWVLYPLQPIKASKSPPITYGTVPSGYYQTVPASGPPPPLQEGKIYGFGADTRGAAGGDIWFSIRGGHSERVEKTDPADPESHQ